MKARGLLLPLTLLLVPCALAQFGSDMETTGNVNVRVTFNDGRACNLQLHVQLMESSSTTPVVEGYTNTSGMLEFPNIRIGNYHLLVSGEGIEETDSGVFEVDPRKVSQYQYVIVKRAGEANSTESKQHTDPTVAAVDLSIPASARNEFDKANEFMNKENWKKAIERLTKALEIYPKFAAAYNNLGVVYSRLKDRVLERQALQKAISINDHFAPAYVNLGRMNILAGDFSGAESALNKASTFAPTDAMTLVLLTYAEFMNRHIDQAIATSRQAHGLPGLHALAHQVAAYAYEQQRDAANAIAELGQFLKEEPVGKRADSARKELEALQALRTASAAKREVQ